MSKGMRAASGSGTGADLDVAVEAAVCSVQAGLADQPGTAGVGPALQDEPPDLAVVFLGGVHAEEAERASGLIHQRLAPRHLLGATAAGVVFDGVELERPDGISVWAACMPGARLTPLRYPPPTDDGPAAMGRQLPDDRGWPDPPEDARALLLLADPFSFPADAFLTWVDQGSPGLPVSGGLASAARAPGANRLLLDREVYDAGAVGMAIGGDVVVRTLVSQGCRPIGQSFVVTRADRNLVQELAGEPPVERIKETFAAAERPDRELMRQGLHIGMVIDEYREEFGRGDFLVRGVVGAQAGTGALAIGDVVQVGQTVQFHVRDADSADDDLRTLLAEFMKETSPPGFAPAGALLFTCNGRGRRLFGEPDHDAELVRDALGEIPVGGFFCAGEIGPVGSRSFLHGFTASLLVFECEQP